MIKCALPIYNLTMESKTKTILFTIGYKKSNLPKTV